MHAGRADDRGGAGEDAAYVRALSDTSSLRNEKLGRGVRHSAKAASTVTVMMTKGWLLLNEKDEFSCCDSFAFYSVALFMIRSSCPKDRGSFLKEACIWPLAP